MLLVSLWAPNWPPAALFAFIDRFWIIGNFWTSGNQGDVYFKIWLVID